MFACEQRFLNPYSVRAVCRMYTLFFLHLLYTDAPLNVANGLQGCFLLWHLDCSTFITALQLNYFHTTELLLSFRLMFHPYFQVEFCLKITVKCYVSPTSTFLIGFWFVRPVPEEADTLLGVAVVQGRHWDCETSEQLCFKPLADVLDHVYYWTASVKVQV